MVKKSATINEASGLLFSHFHFWLLLIFSQTSQILTQQRKIVFAIIASYRRFVENDSYRFGSINNRAKTNRFDLITSFFSQGLITIP